RPMLAVLAAYERAGVRIVEDLFALWIKADDASHTRRDIREMYDGRGQMSGHGIRIWITRIAANAVEEVLVMRRDVGTSRTFRNKLVPLGVQFPAHGMPDDKHPLRAVERGAVLVAFLCIWRPDALLEDELLLLARTVWSVLA